MRTPAALACLVCLTGTASARPGAGTLVDPVVIDAFPYAARGTTTGADHAIDGYSCAAADESGGEVVYRFTLADPGRVSAWVSGLAAGVDVDVHLLGDLTVSGRTAASCVARGDVIAEAELAAGVHALVVDTFTSDAHAGGYVLHVDAVGEAWSERTLATGVVWRTRRTTAPEHQLENEIVADLSAPGVSVRALAATGCQTVATVGAAHGALAGVNGGYFDDTAAACPPVSLLKASGVLLGRNASTSPRGAFGLTPQGVPMVEAIGMGADWPAAFEAQGGGPVLASGGSARAGAAAWAAEGLSSASFLGRNPRTFAGFDAMGHVHFGTVDGRRASSSGLSMDALAAFVVSELGLAGAMNLDGGGSSSLWVAGATPGGIVNYPSDAGETAAHAARTVSGGLFVFAPPYNHPPRFQTQPPTSATVGASYRYDADAIDLDVDDVVTFRLAAAPPGMSVNGATGEVTLNPGPDAPAAIPVVLVASDGRGGETQQAWTLTIAGGQDPGGDGGADASPDGGDGGRGGGDGGGCGCTVARPGGAEPWLLLGALALVGRLRRRRR